MMRLHRLAPELKTELIIAHLLRGGVLTSAVVILAGLIMRLFGAAGPGGASTSEVLGTLLGGQTVGSFRVPHTLDVFVTNLRAFDADTTIAAGLIILIALPVIRVALTIILFALERDYLYLLITSVVFAILLSGIFLGRAL